MNTQKEQVERERANQQSEKNVWLLYKARSSINAFFFFPLRLFFFCFFSSVPPFEYVEEESLLFLVSQVFGPSFIDDILFLSLS